MSKTETNQSFSIVFTAGELTVSAGPYSRGRGESEIPVHNWHNCSVLSRCYHQAQRGLCIVWRKLRATLRNLVNPRVQLDDF